VFKLGSANKAKIAIANRIARVVYKILCGEKYKELGYMRGDPHEQKIKHLVGQLKAMGVSIPSQPSNDCVRKTCCRRKIRNNFKLIL
jgi:hypothetical protein